jgi:HSP20 family molecular chaperone IbpA
MRTTLSSSNILSELLNEIRYNAMPLAKGSRIPLYNVRVDGDTAVYSIALPGYEKSDIQVRCTENLLIVSSNAQVTYDSKHIVTTFAVSPFSVSWQIKGAKVSSATMSNGVLEVVMQRSVSEPGDLVPIT